MTSSCKSPIIDNVEKSIIKIPHKKNFGNMRENNVIDFELNTGA